MEPSDLTESVQPTITIPSSTTLYYGTEIVSRVPSTATVADNTLQADTPTTTSTNKEVWEHFTYYIFRDRYHEVDWTFVALPDSHEPTRSASISERTEAEKVIKLGHVVATEWYKVAKGITELSPLLSDDFSKLLDGIVKDHIQIYAKGPLRGQKLTEDEMKPWREKTLAGLKSAADAGNDDGVVTMDDGLVALDRSQTPDVVKLTRNWYRDGRPVDDETKLGNHEDQALHLAERSLSRLLRDDV